MMTPQMPSERVKLILKARALAGMRVDELALTIHALCDALSVSPSPAMGEDNDKAKDESNG